MSEEPEAIVWLDFETTGLDPTNSRILEIGAVITDLDYTVNAQFHALCNSWSSDALMQPNVLEMHTLNGLLADIQREGQPWHEIAWSFRAFLEMPKVPLVLAGFGVSHMEVPFIHGQLPEVWSNFVYYTYDISTLRRLVKLARPDKLLDGPKGHRALADAYQALFEWQYFAALMREGLF